MSIAHAANYILWEMTQDVHRKEKRRSIVALHTTLEKLAARADAPPTARHFHFGGGGGAGVGTGTGAMSPTNRRHPSLSGAMSAVSTGVGAMVAGVTRLASRGGSTRKLATGASAEAPGAATPQHGHRKQSSPLMTGVAAPAAAGAPTMSAMALGGSTPARGDAAVDGGFAGPSRPVAVAAWGAPPHAPATLHTAVSTGGGSGGRPPLAGTVGASSRVFAAAPGAPVSSVDVTAPARIYTTRDHSEGGGGASPMVAGVEVVARSAIVASDGGLPHLPGTVMMTSNPLDGATADGSPLALGESKAAPYGRAHSAGSGTAAIAGGTPPRPGAPTEAGGDSGGAATAVVVEAGGASPSPAGGEGVDAGKADGDGIGDEAGDDGASGRSGRWGTWLCCCCMLVSQLCTLIRESWRKTSLTRRIDIIITLASATAYLVGSLVIFTLPVNTQGTDL